MVETQTTNTIPATTQTETSQEQQVGKKLASQLYVMLRTCSLYDFDNDSFSSRFEAFRKELNRAFRLVDTADIRSVDGYLFFGEERLRVDLDGYLAARHLQELFDQLDISGFEFVRGIKDETLLDFFKIMSRYSQKDDSGHQQEMRELLGSLKLPGFSLVPVTTLQSSLESPRSIKEEKSLAKQCFFGAINKVGDIVSHAAANRPVPVSKVKRTVHALVDQLLSDETYLMELTALKDFDDYTFVHSVNVSIYAIAMGLRLGLPRPQLAELGFAAIFHDIGKTRIPRDLLNKPGRLNSSDWELLREHPIHGVKLIGNSMTLDTYSARAMLVAFEHHKNLDGSGYPYIDRTCELNFYSRIVAICDFFDAITSRRRYKSEDVGIETAFSEMMKLSASKFDPLLIKVFLNLIGFYPAGTLLLLDTGELAIAISTNPEQIARPRVKIIANTLGLLDKSFVVELADRSEENNFKRNVLRSVNPKKYGIHIEDFILAEE
jgi:HD-GYP domain-containing protein (c-di-GMP phosphodiesterase class II)